MPIGRAGSLELGTGRCAQFGLQMASNKRGSGPRARRSHSRP